MLNMKAIKTRLEVLVKHFTKEYLKAYKTALVLSIRDKIQNRPVGEEPIDWHLMIDPNRLAKNPRIEGTVWIGEGFKQKFHWSMGKNYVVTETPIEEPKAGAASPTPAADGAASPTPTEPPGSPVQGAHTSTGGPVSIDNAADSEKVDDAEKGDPRVWLDDSCAENCMNPTCGEKFGLIKRRTHCRQCGEIFCAKCTKFKIDKDKFCEECYTERTADGVDKSTLLPVLERPKIKIRMLNFYKYKVVLHDSELFAAAGAHEAAAKVKRPEGSGELGKEGQRYLLVLTHRRATRPVVTVAFEKADDRDQWKSLLQSASIFSPQPVTMDPILRKAFLTAYQRTRWYCACWGWWELDGTEGEMLAELFYDTLAREIFGATLHKMGPMPQKMARKAITTMISGATSAMWATVQKGVAAARPPLEKAAESMLEPLFEKEKEIQDKIQAELSAKVEEQLVKHEGALQEKFAETMPVIAAAGESELNLIGSSLKEWREEVDAEGGKKSVLGPWWKYQWIQWRANWMYSHKSKPISEMIDVKLNGEDDSAESKQLASDLKNDFLALNQSAFVVLKDRLLASNPNATEAEYVALAKQEYADIQKRAAHDINIILTRRLLKALDATLRPPLETVLAAVIDAICEPLNALIPDLLKDVLDPARMCMEIIDRMLREKEVSLIEKAMRPMCAGVTDMGERLGQQGM